MAGKVPWPESLPMDVGHGIDLEMHDGNLRGRLTITAKETEPYTYRALWTCPGSEYDGREFLLSPGLSSDVAGLGEPRTVPAPYCLAH